MVNDIKCTLKQPKMRYMVSNAHEVSYSIVYSCSHRVLCVHRCNHRVKIPSKINHLCNMFLQNCTPTWQNIPERYLQCLSCGKRSTIIAKQTSQITTLPLKITFYVEEIHVCASGYNFHDPHGVKCVSVWENGDYPVVKMLRELT